MQYGKSRNICPRLCVVVDRVRVGEDAAAGDDKAAAGGRVLPLPLPGQREVGLRVHTEHLHIHIYNIIRAAMSHIRFTCTYYYILESERTHKTCGADDSSFTKTL